MDHVERESVCVGERERASERERAIDRKWFIQHRERESDRQKIVYSSEQHGQAINGTVLMTMDGADLQRDPLASVRSLPIPKSPRPSISPG